MTAPMSADRQALHKAQDQLALALVRYEGVKQALDRGDGVLQTAQQAVRVFDAGQAKFKMLREKAYTAAIAGGYTPPPDEIPALPPSQEREALARRAAEIASSIATLRARAEQAASEVEDAREAVADAVHSVRIRHAETLAGKLAEAKRTARALTTALLNSGFRLPPGIVAMIEDDGVRELAPAQNPGAAIAGLWSDFAARLVDDANAAAPEGLGASIDNDADGESMVARNNRLSRGLFDSLRRAS
jgi:hypothetical protein